MLVSLWNSGVLISEIARILKKRKNQVTGRKTTLSKKYYFKPREDKYSLEFKLEVLRAYEESGHKRVKIADEFGISRNTLDNFIATARMFGLEEQYKTPEEAKTTKHKLKIVEKEGPKCRVAGCSSVKQPGRLFCAEHHTLLVVKA